MSKSRGRTLTGWPLRVRASHPAKTREPVASTAEAFGFSRPSWYAAAAALDEDGLPGLLPARPGPRRAHKLTEEVVADLRAALEEDPTLRTADLVAHVEARFGLVVHPRSIERALARSEHPKS